VEEVPGPPGLIDGKYSQTAAKQPNGCKIPIGLSAFSGDTDEPAVLVSALITVLTAEGKAVSETARDVVPKEKKVDPFRVVGKRVGHYDIVDWVDNGGMGAVYAGRHVLDGTIRRALKFIRVRRDDEPAWKQALSAMPVT
jgi:hypothetical protein